MLQENGVPSPGALNEFVKEDVDRYGVRLNGLKAKLQKAREDQLDQAPLGAVIGDHDLFMDNSEALLRSVHAFLCDSKMHLISDISLPSAL